MLQILGKKASAFELKPNLRKQKRETSLAEDLKSSARNCVLFSANALQTNNRATRKQLDRKRFEIELFWIGAFCEIETHFDALSRRFRKSRSTNSRNPIRNFAERSKTERVARRRVAARALLAAPDFRGRASFGRRLRELGARLAVPCAHRAPNQQRPDQPELYSER